MKAEKKTVLLVIGTRPEAIKMAPLALALKKENWCRLIVCLSGQHGTLVRPILNFFGVKPNYDLKIMKANQSLDDIICATISGLRKIMTTERPSLTLVHGDTATAAAAAISSFINHIPVGHVEAGLRTGDLDSPWPEEGNRKLITSIANLHFAPTKNSAKNLIREGVSPAAIKITGNTVIDSLPLALKRMRAGTRLGRQLKSKYHAVVNRKLILVTCHRRENMGENLVSVCEALTQITKDNPNVDILFPVHPNPRIREVVHTSLGQNQQIKLLQPLDYPDFVFLMKEASLILTDSGGIQEEAPSLGKPVLVMRNVTERPEALAAGTVTLVGTDKTKITQQVSNLLTDRVRYRKMSKSHNPYGDGRACERIIEAIRSQN